MADDPRIDEIMDRYAEYIGRDQARFGREVVRAMLAAAFATRAPGSAMADAGLIKKLRTVAAYTEVPLSDSNRRALLKAADRIAALSAQPANGAMAELREALEAAEPILANLDTLGHLGDGFSALAKVRSALAHPASAVRGRRTAPEAPPPLSRQVNNAARLMRATEIARREWGSATAYRLGLALGMNGETAKPPADKSERWKRLFRAGIVQGAEWRLRKADSQ